MEDNNQFESTNSGALGEFSILSPSQRKELEQKEKEQEKQKQAEAAKVAAEKAKKQKEIERMEKQEQLRWTCKMLLWLAVTIMGCYLFYAFWITAIFMSQEVTLEGFVWFMGLISPVIVVGGGLIFLKTIISK